MPGNLPSSQYPVSMPTTQSWDPGQIYSIEVNSPEFKNLIVKMYQQLNLMATILNFKETGQYNNSFETINGQNWYPNPAYNSGTAGNATQRPVFRTVVFIPTTKMPNANTTIVAHNINPTSAFTFTRIYGAATNPSTTYAPIPYVFVGVAAGSEPPGPLELWIDPTNVNLKSTANWTAFTAYIIIEYIKT